MKGLTAEDRALIDAALNAGKVTVVAQGATSRPLPVWDGKQLVYPESARRELKAVSFGRRSASVAAQQSRRRERVAALHAQGLPTAAIASEIGADARTIREDLRALALVPHRAPRVMPPRPATPHPAIEARKARIAALAAEGCTADEISADVRLNAKAVRAIARHMGVAIAKRPKVFREAAAKREEIRLRVAQGHTQAEICKALGMAANTLRAHLNRLGISALDVPTGRARDGARSEIARRRQAVNDRRAQLAMLAGEGLSVADIAARVGVHEGTVRRDLRTIGVKVARPVPGCRARRDREAGDLPPLLRARAERRARLAELHAAGMGRAAIRAELGIAPSLLRADLAALGLRLPREDHGVQAYSAGLQAQVEDRRQRITALAAGGASFDDVLSVIGVSFATLRKDFNALRISRRRPSRTAQVVALRAEGLTISAISERLGMSKSCIHRALHGSKSGGDAK